MLTPGQHLPFPFSKSFFIRPRHLPFVPVGYGSELTIKGDFELHRFPAKGFPLTPGEEWPKAGWGLTQNMPEEVSS